MTRFAFGIWAIVLIAGCGPGAPTRSTTTNDTGAWGPAPKLVEELHIGEVEAEPEYTFGSISEIAVGLDGAIFVADARPVSLRLYDSTGRFVRSIGRKGEGPGEYRGLDGLVVLRDGRIVLRDDGLGRISIFSGAGEYRTSYQVKMGYRTADDFRIDTAGNFYVKGLSRSAVDVRCPLDRPLVWIRIDSLGQVRDTVAIPQPDTVVHLYGGPDRTQLAPLLTSLSPFGYLATGDPRTYAFELHPPGQPPVRIERAHTPVPFTREEKAEWENAAAFYSGRLPDVCAKYIVPELKPAYRALTVDEEGRIWIERYVEAQEMTPPRRFAGDQRPAHAWREPRTLNVFEPTGRFLGTIVMPAGAWFDVRRGRQLWGNVSDSLGVQYVVRYRVEN